MKPTLVIQEGDRTITKYTSSFELKLEVELRDPKSCSGCPLLVSMYENRCNFLGEEIPERKEGNVVSMGRHHLCPLIKVEERRPKLTECVSPLRLFVNEKGEQFIRTDDENYIKI